jgi:hypothetical protein
VHVVGMEEISLQNPHAEMRRMGTRNPEAGNRKPIVGGREGLLVAGTMR